MAYVSSKYKELSILRIRGSWGGTGYFYLVDVVLETLDLSVWGFPR